MKSITFAVLFTLLGISKSFAAPDPNFHIYLAFGQSNMEGQGPIEGQDKTVDKRFQMISTVSGCGRQLGNWYDAVPPLANCDGKLGPVDYFGRTMVKNLPSQIKVGVAVVAIAGCDIQLFEKSNYRSYNAPSYMSGRISAYGGNPYGRLVEMGKKAQQVGVIKGILLHQGETNTGQQNWPNRVKAIYESLLSDLGLKAQDVPLLAGEVVQSSQGGSCGGMNSIIQKLPQVIPTAHVISSQGLGQQGDGLHFTSAAYRTFGERYAQEMLKLVGTTVSSSTGSNTTTSNNQSNQSNNNNNNWNQNNNNNNNNSWNQNNNNNNGWNNWNNWGTSNNNASSNNNSNNNANCAGLWAQCGGQGFNGPTCCKEGTCKAVSTYYSQCHK